jgi:alcohol dehydrogenase class IV
MDVKLTQTMYSFPTLVEFGAGVLQNLPKRIMGYGSKALVVTDPGMLGLPPLAQLQQTLRDAGVPFELFSGINPNPLDTDVDAGVDAYRAGACDVVVGIGGGSAMDGAKAVALMATHDGNILDYDDADGGSERIRDVIPPMITIPTTAGTGSEVGRSTVVIDTKRNVKVVVFSPFLMPNLALIDPELHVSMPPRLTAATGMDALTHNVEALLSKGFHPMADAIALEGIRLIGEHLVTAVQNGENVTARGGMAMAAAMGATAFQKGLGVIHSLAHPCSTIAGVHHGLANGVLIETGLRFNRDVAGRALARIATVLGIVGPPSDTRADAAIEWIAALRDDIGIPSRLQDVGVTQEMLPEMERQAMKDGCHLCNPKAVSAADIHELYKQAF